MFKFCPSDYGQAVAELLLPQRLAELGPGTPNKAALERSTRLTDQQMLGENRLARPCAAAACRAALWLHHDYLDESHRISQTLEDRDGSYWHALMHRREPDPQNAKYWFRRVGTHPVYPALQAATLELAETDTFATEPDRPKLGALTADGEWDPIAFVDLCESASRGDASQQLLCRRIQLCEWQLLFDHCFRLAAGRDEPLPHSTGH